MLQLRNSFKISPGYLTSLILPIYWLLILKLFSYVGWDFGLNNIISVLYYQLMIFCFICQMFSKCLVVWAKCLVVSSHDWCAYLSFQVICETVAGLYHLQNDVHHYVWLLCWGHLWRWGTVKEPRQILTWGTP